MIATVIISMFLAAYALKIVVNGIKDTQKALKGQGCSGCQYKKKPIVQIEFK